MYQLLCLFHLFENEKHDCNQEIKQDDVDENWAQNVDAKDKEGLLVVQVAPASHHGVVCAQKCRLIVHVICLRFVVVVFPMELRRFVEGICECNGRYDEQKEEGL